MKPFTIHHSRTMMFAELERVIEAGLHYDSFIDAIDDNVIGKKSTSALKLAKRHLTALYTFDREDRGFSLFLKLWAGCTEPERRLLTLLLALRKDELLRHSVPFIRSLQVGEVASRDALQDSAASIADYTPESLIKVATRLLSSWKQAGFLKGKVKAVRIKPDISFKIAAFAIALGRFEDLSGQYLLNTPYVRALCLSSAELEVLFNEAKINDYLGYQNAGNVTVFTLGKQMAAHELEN